MIKLKVKQYKVRPSSGTDIYPHMPILRPHATLFHERRVSSVTCSSTYLYGNVHIPVGVAHAQAYSSDLGLVGEQRSQKLDIPCLVRRWNAVQNLMLLALSLAEKSVTVQTNKQTNCKRYIHTLHIGMW